MQQREKHEEYVRQNRRTVDPYAGVTSTAELIWLAHERRGHDPLIIYLPPPKPVEELYASLTGSEAERLVALVANALEPKDRSRVEGVARHLAAFTDFNLDPMLITWVGRDHSLPPIAFRRAGQRVRERLMEYLHAHDANADHALQAAAWIGGSEVIRELQDLDTNRPAWVKDLYIRPSDYARCAAWEINNGERRELSLETCFAIAPSTTPESDGVRLFEERTDHCPWCKNPLTNLIAADETVAALLGLPWTPFEVVSCFQCDWFGTMFGEADAKGRVILANLNAAPSIIPEKWSPSPWAGKPVKLIKRRAIHAADAFLATDHTQIGGLPAWVQDVNYPRCPRCEQTMIFISQIDNGHFRGHEGVYYVFACGRCRITASSYQQT